MTPEQLRQNAAAMIAFADGKPIEVKHATQHKRAWGECLKPTFECERWNYRPKAAPVTRPWSKPGDVPWPCFIAVLDNHLDITQNECSLVVGYKRQGLEFTNQDGSVVFWEWDELQDGVTRYSTDRINWLPCTVTE